MTPNEKREHEEQSAEQDESGIVTWTAPHHKVLVVAVKKFYKRDKDTNERRYCWIALIKDVPGESHERELQSVRDHGAKLTEFRARAFFPIIDERLGGRLPYVY